MTDVPPGTWTLDPDATTVEVVAKNFFVRSVRGSFRVREGTATVGEDPRASTLQIVLDASSFSTGNEKRDAHVRGEDFLAVDAHPDITYASSAVSPTGHDYSVVGDLGVAGTTTSVTFDLLVTDAHDGRAHVRATTWVDRHELGLSKLPALMIGRTVAVTVDGRASRA